MVGLDQQSAPKQLNNEVPSHMVLVNNKVGARILSECTVLFKQHNNYKLSLCCAKIDLLPVMYS